MTQTRAERRAREQARKLTEQELGRKLRTDEHVHHRDGNPFNNARENLEVLTAQAHARLHHPPNPTPRHQRAERRQYMRWYLAAYHRRTHPEGDRRNHAPAFAPATCVVCQKTYQRNRYWGGETCSHSCGTTLFWRRRRVAALR